MKISAKNSCDEAAVPCADCVACRFDCGSVDSAADAVAITDVAAISVRNQKAHSLHWPSLS